MNLLENKTNVAAAWVHEAVYKTLRDRGYLEASQGSIPARRLTGCLFSSSDACFGAKTTESQIDWSKAVYYCKSEYAEYYVANPRVSVDDDIKRKL